MPVLPNIRSGLLVVRECVKEGVEVECLPGATAFVPALVSSGIPNDRFCFEGFLPQEKRQDDPVENIGRGITDNRIVRIASQGAENTGSTVEILNIWAKKDMPPHAAKYLRCMRKQAEER